MCRRTGSWHFRVGRGFGEARGGCGAASVSPSLELKQGFGPRQHGCVAWRHILPGRGSPRAFYTSSALQRNHCPATLTPSWVSLAAPGLLLLNSRPLTFQAAESLPWTHSGSWPAQPPS